MLLDKLNDNQIEKIFNIFELKQYNIEKNKKKCYSINSKIFYIWNAK